MLSLIPVIVGIIASMFVSLFAINTQSSLDYVDQNPWMLQTYNNINAIILLLPLLAISGEFSIIINQLNLLFVPETFFSLVLSGILGFLIGICTNLQIKYTSALTHNVSGTAKSCLQTIIAVIINKETDHSIAWWIGSILVLVGSGLYSCVRNNEMVKSHQSSNPPENNN
uniref:GDP-fucose transporter 1 (Trinotate prediction) n=1 Tax=Henneguya salminicola TaxID=69463 RepID=A0A6G3MHN2_HENSL